MPFLAEGARPSEVHEGGGGDGGGVGGGVGVGVGGGGGVDVVTGRLLSSLDFRFCRGRGIFPWSDNWIRRKSVNIQPVG